MTSSSGYAGNILWVDLSTGGTERVPTERYADLFLGGRGLVAKIYWDEVPPGREDDSLEEFNFTMPLKGDTAGNPDAIVPGPEGETFARKGMVVDPGQFEEMKNEYYAIRGWDVRTGLQKRARLDELGLGYVAGELDRQGLRA